MSPPLCLLWVSRAGENLLAAETAQREVLPGRIDEEHTHFDFAVPGMGFGSAVKLHQTIQGAQLMFGSGMRIATALFFVSGCSGLGWKDPDHTPLNPTVVQETRMVSSGVQDFATFDILNVTRTRADMQRSESSFQAGGGLSRLPNGEAQVRIERLDKKLAWTLDARNKKAIECPLKGCITSGTRKPPPKKIPDAENARDSGCRLKLGNTAFTSEATGEKRNINGFDTEHHEIKWVAVLRDNAARKSTSTVSIDLWMAPGTTASNEARLLETRFRKTRAKLVGFDKQEDPIVPHEVDTVINTLLSASVSPADRAAFLAGMGKLDGIAGTPIVVQVKWDLSGVACAMDENMKDLGEKSVFMFMSELKSHKVVPLHDSLFVPPTGYKILK